MKTPDMQAEERVYFIGEVTEDREHGPIKIGIAANPAARLAQIQVSNPRELIMLRWFDAPAGTEKKIHRRLGEHWIRGEWFEPHMDVLETLDEYETTVQCDECDRVQRYLDRGYGKPDLQMSRHVCGLTDGQLNRRFAGDAA